MAATTLIALMALAINFDLFTFFSTGDVGQRVTIATNSAGLGIILAAAATFHMLERDKAGRPEQFHSPTRIPGYLLWLALPPSQYVFSPLLSALESGPFRRRLWCCNTRCSGCGSPI